MINTIIAFFQRLFRIFRTPTTSTEKQYAPHPSTEDRLDASKASTKISYSNTLIPELKHDHEELVRLYSQIGSDIQSQDYANIQTTLGTLKIEFNRHIMQENVSFYCYLEQQFSDDENHLETIKFYRKEMNGISHAFVKFIKKWQTTALNDESIAEFTDEYNVIGEVLAKRINSEENHLYTLYQPS